MHSKYVHHVTKKPIPVISLTGVTSKQVKEVGYDPETKTLAVTFNHGKSVYHYPNVEEKTFKEMIKAESIGKFFGKHIKPITNFDKYVPHEE
jgi:hypothetical protein